VQLAEACVRSLAPLVAAGNGRAHLALAPLDVALPHDGEALYYLGVPHRTLPISILCATFNLLAIIACRFGSYIRREQRLLLQLAGGGLIFIPPAIGHLGCVKQFYFILN
jgi:hypothetical protein